MTDHSLSILHVLTTRAPRYGGPPRMAELCTALGRLGHHVELVSTTLDGPNDLAVPVGVPLQEEGFVSTAFPVVTPRSYTFSPSLVHWLWRNVPRFDVVHVHSVYLFTTFAAARISRAKSVPYVWHPHGALTEHHRSHHRSRKVPYERLIERPNARSAAEVIWESEREQAEAVAAGWPVGSVVWSGAWVPEQIDPSNRRPDEVVFLGRLAEKKGVDLLVEAFARVAAERPEARLRLVGPDDGERAAALADRAATLGIRDRVSFEGFLRGDEKEDALQRAAVHVLPSADESFGAAAIEAMAYATPVVVTRAFPFADELNAREGCVLVERNPSQIAEGILMLLSDRKRSLSIGENGRRFVAERFSWEKIAQELTRLYAGAVARAKASRGQSAYAATETVR